MCCEWVTKVLNRKETTKARPGTELNINVERRRRRRRCDTQIAAIVQFPSNISCIDRASEELEKYCGYP